jgi:hypothetical protein
VRHVAVGVPALPFLAVSWASSWHSLWRGNNTAWKHKAESGPWCWLHKRELLTVRLPPRREAPCPSPRPCRGPASPHLLGWRSAHLEPMCLSLDNFPGDRDPRFPTYSMGRVPRICPPEDSILGSGSKDRWLGVWAVELDLCWRGLPYWSEERLTGHGEHVGLSLHLPHTVKVSKNSTSEPILGYYISILAKAGGYEPI